jgi:hypothetical protein
VDVGAAADACSALVADDLLRARMRAAAPAAAAAFDWSAVAAGYRQLFADLAELRGGHRIDPCPAELSVRVPNPFSVFRHYATDAVSLDHRVELLDLPGQPDPSALFATPLCDFVFDVRCSRAELERVWHVVQARAPQRLGSFVGELRDIAPDRLFACLLWLAKFGFVRLTAAA